MKGVFAALLLLSAAGAAEWGLSAKRPADNPALAESAFAAFGGFRAIAAEVVWFRAERLQEEGRYVELAQLAHALTLAEPHTPEVWSYAAWNLAYNVSVMMPTPADRWRWVDEAISLLRDGGLRYNPDSAELYRELAWLFQLKLGGSLDDAAAHYRREWTARIRDVAARDAWEEELRMVPWKMEEVERTLGIDDRTDPLYSAIYWAADGLRATKGKGQDSRFLAEVIRQSMVVYQKRHPRKLPEGGEGEGPRAPKAGPFKENARG